MTVVHPFTVIWILLIAVAALPLGSTWTATVWSALMILVVLVLRHSPARTSAHR